MAEPYDVVHRNLYRVHQRVAATFRTGRVFLAGDSAHVNNPIGGLGLNCGIHDAMELVDTLHLVVTGQAEESLLGRYERRRRSINIEFVQQTTVANKKRLEEQDAKIRRSTAAQTIPDALVAARKRAQGEADPIGRVPNERGRSCPQLINDY